MKAALQTRAHVCKALDLIIYQKYGLDAALKGQTNFEGMAQADLNFMHLLLLTTLRRYGQAEKLLSLFLEKPLPSKRKVVHLILIMGIVQLYFLKTPPHAAIDTSVALVRFFKQSSFTKLVNGVLRAFARKQTQIDMPDLSHNIPEWLWNSWVKTYGAAQAKQFCDYFVSDPTLDLSVKADPQFWAEKLNGQVLNTRTVRLKNVGNIVHLPGFQAGDWWVQEASASIPVQLFTQLNGLKVADFCAAPGGKTAQMAVAGAFVDAYDISAKRLERLSENMNRLGLCDRVQFFEKDIASDASLLIYDAVLVDAPCSATGTIKRHPDLYFHREKTDVLRLAALQKQILSNAIQCVRAGGEIVYATCSLQEEENEAVVLDILKEYPMVKRKAIQVPHLQPFLNKNGAIQVTPDQGQDGFYAVLLYKESV